MKKLIFIIPLVILLAGCTSSKVSPQTNSVTTPETTPIVTPAITPTITPEVNNNVPENSVTYTDTGFSPATITIKKGDTVTFKNMASDDVWVASNPHPQHTDYPTTGGCIGSTFDSCANIKPNDSWSFKFDVVGSWGYHNHLNHSEGGTVIVK